MLTPEDLEAIRRIVREEIARSHGESVEPPLSLLGADPEDVWVGYKEAAKLLGYPLHPVKYALNLSVKRYGDHKTARYLKSDLLEYMQRRERTGWMTIEAAKARLFTDHLGASMPHIVREGCPLVPVLEVEVEYERRRDEIERERALTPEQRRQREEQARERAREIMAKWKNDPPRRRRQR